MSKQAKNNNHQTPSTIASWYLTLLQAFEHLGVDTIQLAREAGLPPKEQVNPNDRISIDKMTTVWQLAAKNLNDDAIGIKVSDYVHANTLNALGLSLISSGTIRQAWQRLLQFSALISNVLEVSTKPLENKHTALCFQRIDGVPCSNEAVDAFLATAVRLASDNTGGKALPVQVDLERLPHANQEIIRHRLGNNINYQQESNRLIYLDADLDRPVEKSNEALAQQLDVIARTLLDEFNANSLTDKVRRLLVEQLKNGTLDKQHVATSLAMSSRNLQRKLEQENTSYSLLLKEVRLNLAKKLLNNELHSITDIALLLGFNDASSFSKAFKEWAQMSPRDYRNQL